MPEKIVVPLAQFSQWLRDSGVLSTAELAAIENDWPPETLGSDPSAALAMQLIRHRRLTPYQTKVIYNGLPHLLVYDNYVVTDKIGQGGMGLVFKVRQRESGEEGALKIVSAHGMTKSKTAVERFRREVGYLFRLSHPNIVRAIHAGQVDGANFLVTEFVDGVDLKKKVKEQGPLTVPDAVEFTMQTARGLQHAHESGVIHRDIKPGNLLLNKEGVVKILDFGLARLDDAEAETNLTQMDVVLGTAEYIAPEQAVSTRLADQRSDIYSLGCTLFFLLTGRPMYGGSSPVTKMLAHRQQPIPRLTAERADVPATLEAVHQKMVAKQPNDRYQSMAELIVALQQVLATPADASANPPVIVERSTNNSAQRRRWWQRLGDFVQRLARARPFRRK